MADEIDQLALRLEIVEEEADALVQILGRLRGPDRSRAAADPNTWSE